MTRGHQGTSRIKSVRSHSRLVVRLAICFAIAVVTAGLLAGCGSETSLAPSSEVQAMLQDRLEAMNAADTQAIAKLYAVNAVLDNYIDNNKHLQGKTAIADYITSVVNDYGMQWAAEGDPIQYDKYVVQPVRTSGLGDSPGTGAELHIFDIDSNGEIAHSWIIGWVKP